VPWSSGGVGQFTFCELCDESLGPADYLTLAARFHTIGISNIPILRLADKNQARRFISLIDALYEARCRVVCLAETKPEELFFPDAPPDENLDVMLAESVSETRDGYRPNVSAYDSPAMSRNFDAPAKAVALDTLSIFSGQEEQFAFKLALSRLIEMTSLGREALLLAASCMPVPGISTHALLSKMTLLPRQHICHIMEG